MIAMMLSGTQTGRCILSCLRRSIFLKSPENAYAGPGQAEFGEEQV
ncbi:hypothetical protein HY30_04860 [Hyphomonas chukchiensis]|uniref:Uncharacterized protein n=1 Tax=Hyphomonas chukchiensis TaxID=1280947 RepID=A0A062UN00_9PROT|nr:hypothetical protein HY30_04860 [Hyphomonas chukchiensis]